jgi:predicted transcriptional regulator
MANLRKDFMRLNQPPPIPKGWATVAQLAKRDGITTSNAQEMLLKLVRAGVWERKPWRIACDCGSRRVLIYRRK